MSNKVVLPAREQAMFKRILKYYEQKQYKNGLKACKYILSQPKFAEHGETQALKGLTLNCLDRKVEAYELVKKGLRNDMTSHVCWHVYGLLYRSDKNYTQAIKCYRSALRFDKENTQILRDLSLLQVQMRDLKGYKITRHSLLLVRPQQRQSWLGYAISLHLLGHGDEALKVITAYEKTQSDHDKSGGPDYEQSELVMYRARILFEGGKYSDCLQYLQDNQAEVTDVLALQEVVGELLIKLGRLEEAELCYRRLLDDNVENNDYYSKLEECTKLGDGTPEADRVKLYHDFLTDRPRAHAPKRLPLMFTSGALFRGLLDEYLRPCLRKGMAPVFRNIRKVYTDAAKVKLVEEVGESYVAALTAGGKFDTRAETQAESPVTLVWAKYFLAQHYDAVGDLERALVLINEAIDHTPTILELYMVKAKIYKHAGNCKDAAHWLNFARELDTADRFINSKCVKYLLRANDFKTAEETASLFTRESSDPIASLSEMQCIWFETESAATLLSLGETGKSLKKLSSISGHFDQMVEDQFDFHTYCMRKMTLRAYIDLLRTEDKLKAHKLYYEAAIVAVRAYIGLHDVPFGSKERDEQDAAMAGLTPSELKKMISKQKKAARRAQAEKEAAAAKAPKKKNDNDGEAKKAEDNDPEGKELAKTKVPLDEAMRFLRPLQMLSPTQLLPHLMAFEVNLRKKKVLLMLQSLKKALAIAPQDPGVFKATARFLKYFAQAQADKEAPLNPTLVAVVEAELGDLKIAARDSIALATDRLASNKNSFADVLACAEITNELVGDKVKAAKILTDVADFSAMTGVTAQLCARALYVLKTVLGQEAGAFGEQCKKACPLADLDAPSYLNVAVV